MIFYNISLKESNSEKLQNEYNKLVQGLRDEQISREEQAILVNPGKS
jgi:hypothetical protein